ncbi:MAG: hypothetical protein ACPH9O_10015 [Akkermansiaceae bacterium]
MSLSNSRTRLLLIVAAFFLAITFLAYLKLGRKSEELSDQQRSENTLTYTRSPQKTLGPDAPGDKARLSGMSQKRAEQDTYLAELRKLSSQSPADAIVEVLNMAPGSLQRRAMAIVFDQWAKQDPAAAGTWILQNTTIPQQLLTTASMALAKQWTTSAPESALKWSGTYFEQTDDHGAFQNAIITWTRQDLAAAGKHIAEQSYGETPDYLATMEFVNIYSQKDVEAAMQWVEANTPQDLQPDTQMVIIDRLAREDPTRAAEYVMRSDNQENIDSNLDALLLQWANTDINAATEWVNNSLNPEHRDTAYIQLAEISRDQQPALAIQYAQALGDDNYRQTVTKDILSDWRDQNRGAADQWISENMDNLGTSILEEVGYTAK